VGDQLREPRSHHDSKSVSPAHGSGPTPGRVLAGLSLHQAGSLECYPGRPEIELRPQFTGAAAGDPTDLPPAPR